MFHALKKFGTKVIGSAPAAASNDDGKSQVFDEMKVVFTQFYENIQKTQKSIESFSGQLKTICFASGHIAESFNTYFAGAQFAHNNNYGGTVSDGAKAHEELNKSIVESCAIRLKQSTDHLEGMIVQCKEFKKRIKTRDDAVEEMKYYVEKMATLVKEREKVQSSGKQHKPADIEKFDRNKSKLDEKTKECNDMNTQLFADMQQFLGSRLDRMAPIVNDFYEAERMLTSGWASLLLPLTQPSPSAGRSAVMRASMSQSRDSNSAGIDTNGGEAGDDGSPSSGSSASVSVSRSAGQRRPTANNPFDAELDSLGTTQSSNPFGEESKDPEYDAHDGPSVPSRPPPPGQRPSTNPF